ncbi:MAG TPA: hypothetical protein VFM94_00350 [Solirubrobacterales bacterium]|nr:hypothetical protein [Solirubrobacterales bacterium]
MERCERIRACLGRLGLTCLALAVFAVAAPAAGASVQDTFNSHIEPTVLTGSSASGDLLELTPEFRGGCNSSVAGTMKTKTVSEITLHPTIFECVLRLGGLGGEEFPATVDTAGCNLKITGLTDEGGPLGPMGTTSIECSTGKAVIVTVPFCAITIPAQTIASGTGTSFLNVQNGLETSEWDIRTLYLYREMNYTASGMLCGFYGVSGGGKTADYEGVGTIKGWEDNGGPANEDQYTDGEQTGIWYSSD